MTEIDFRDIKRVHLIGLGGIGVSALARMFLSFGALVSGSDNNKNSIIDDLQKKGITFYQEHQADNITSDIEIVIYTIAIDDNNPEFKKAKELGIRLFSYPEALGVLSKQMKTVAVAGTHGKTTTTAMIAQIAQEAGLNPTVIVGSLLAEKKTNFIAGGNNLLIVEACEYRRSFLNLWPDI
ncbi:MAG TPA: UDP-N-acetylmuramate--L-alanine ligase, partial [Candidatus Vogelbacteria bacterium]|nr:UDP-N-acetylmuramate--L-alanine ligase [Candidatus Vogelbacteria bacterium]